MNEPTLDDLVHAGKRRWGGEHLVVGEATDGILSRVYLHAERDGDLDLLASADSRLELLVKIQALKNAAQQGRR